MSSDTITRVGERGAAVAYAPSASGTPSTTTFRRDIQGLRAVAVLLVVANHLVGWPAGGFIGVDVFFVISGFLITGLLASGLERTGLVGFREFYARRARRILPMAVLVLVATVAAAYLVLAPQRAHDTLVGALYSFVFLENWHLVATGTDYWHLGEAASPVQQYWSLSVEEQFYLVWPVLLMGLWALARRPRVAAVAGIGVLVSASFAWAVMASSASPAGAYFSTFTRGWELGVGALLALALPRLPDLPMRARRALAAVGLLLIGAGALMIDPGTRFPGPLAAIPVMGAALVIAAGAGGVQPRSALLDNRVSQYVGAISYSLYLWHFPVIIFLGLLLPAGSLSLAVMVVVMVALSAASYRWVEEPVRRSTWLSARGERSRARTELRPDGLVRVGYAAGSAALALAVAWLLLLGPGGQWQQARTSAAPALSVAPAEVPSGSGAQAPQSPSEVGAGEGAAVEGEGAAAVGEDGGTGAAAPAVDPLEQPTAVVQAGLAAAHDSASWPELNMYGDWANWAAGVEAGQCQTRLTEARLCIFDTPGATGTAMVVGDSMAAAWFPALQESLLGHGYRVEVYYLVGCPVALVPIHKHQVGAPRNEECDEFREMVAARVAEIGPDVTVVAAAWRQQELVLSGATGVDLEREWRDGMTAAVDRFARSSGRTVVLDAPPGANKIKECFTAVSVPQECERPVQPLAAQASRVNGEAVAHLRTLGMDVSHVDVARWFCLPDGTCPAFYSDMPVYTDGTHPSPAYAAYLAPLVTSAAFGQERAASGPVAGG